MLKYLIILLDDTSVSFCHYDNPYKESNLISINTLKAAIRFAMEENLMTLFVYPKYNLPKEYLEIIDTIDSEGIVPIEQNETGNTVVWENWTLIDFNTTPKKTYILRTNKSELFLNYEQLFKLFPRISRLNIILTDIDSFEEKDFEEYKTILDKLQLGLLESKCYSSTQINILTDRMMLSSHNHCNAGVESITIAPNGKFYICPSFYYYNKDDSSGDLSSGLEIKNAQLYDLEHAPLCRKCDALHCKRCVWLNKTTTGEVNIPSHEQCVLAHLEREASRSLLSKLKSNGFGKDYNDIERLDYLDPFEHNKR